MQQSLLLRITEKQELQEKVTARNQQEQVRKKNQHVKEKVQVMMVLLHQRKRQEYRVGGCRSCRCHIRCKLFPAAEAPLVLQQRKPLSNTSSNSDTAAREKELTKEEEKLVNIISHRRHGVEGAASVGVKG